MSIHVFLDNRSDVLLFNERLPWLEPKLILADVVVATSREDHRSPRSGRAVQHRRWGRERATGRYSRQRSRN